MGRTYPLLLPIGESRSRSEISERARLRREGRRPGGGGGGGQRCGHAEGGGGRLAAGRAEGGGRRRTATGSMAARRPAWWRLATCGSARGEVGGGSGMDL
uniref:Uncharacterized protein n=1 Tax=Oryza sativa subsp. japonica TaxID=39947 RepID=Q6H447_ORYSJ|nr:hypothetical protein [Oryza sativa Japonica Group]BAD26502.1 hypothetical protein [Oryza sativa Japonica Group]